MIKGVKIKKITSHYDDRGFFAEVVKLGEETFHPVQQTSYTETYPGIIKAFHFHKKQDETWFICKGHARVVLHDLRKDSPTKGQTDIVYSGENDKKLIFIPNVVFSFALTLISFLYLLFINLLNFFQKNSKEQYALLLLFILFLFGGLIVSKTPSGAYLMSLFVPVIIMISLLLEHLSKYKYVYFILILLVIYISLVNSVYLIYNNYYLGLDKGYGPSFKERINVAKYMIKDSDSKSFTVYGKGEGSSFESFTMNYQYLTWYYGKEYKKRDGDVIYILEEFSNEIKIKKIN